jgi:hypothetical protein
MKICEKRKDHHPFFSNVILQYVQSILKMMKIFKHNNHSKKISIQGD